MKDVMQKIKNDIENSGRSCITVAGEHTYSVGEALVNSKDIILSVPLQPSLCATLINDTCTLIRSGELGNQKSDKVIKGFDVWILPCNDKLTSEHTGAGLRYYTEHTDSLEKVTYWQLVLPDSKGQFPWENAYDSTFIQPLYCNPPAH
ncbi:DUF4262 domain-containing protein [Alteromonas antoniana]|uniref:DUF4262 domain-containing protein n=1 Tax=Alteromonas antoniana TaxID=2803813 RepID=UPI001C45FEA8|nr:DUF4262 domain-containing protein [Alteromonas antoniana]